MLAGTALGITGPLVGQPIVEAPHIFALGSLEVLVSSRPGHARLGGLVYPLKEVLSREALALAGVDVLHARGTASEARCKAQGASDKVRGAVAWQAHACLSWSEESERSSGA